MMERKIDIAVVHCSDLGFGTPEGIKRYHIEHNRWDDIGYHYVVENGLRRASSSYNERADGLVTQTLTHDAVGRHAWGLNRVSLGICYVGKSPTDRQLDALVRLCASLEKQLGGLTILGHCETKHEQRKPVRPANPIEGVKYRKTCPNLNMDLLRRRIQAHGATQ